jgi:hypothetical protein
VSNHPPHLPQAEMIADSPPLALQVRRGTNSWTPIPSGASGKSTSCRRAARCVRAGGAYGPVIRAARPKAAVLGAVRVSPRYIYPLGCFTTEKHGLGRRICGRRSGRTKATSPSVYAAPCSHADPLSWEDSGAIPLGRGPPWRGPPGIPGGSVRHSGRCRCRPGCGAKEPTHPQRRTQRRYPRRRSW